ncbi:MAG TPA: hypothetical protein DC001_06025 [Clostridiales bacterium]|nr:hypothetical protein [Clostridiales bacterium]HBR07442.1 hypothetical protein [Clostridiales bacterium]
MSVLKRGAFLGSQTILLCAEIFLCRILDVSFGTLRTILTVREKSALAAVVGFFEVFIWFVVVRQALSSADSGFAIAIAYAGGYAAGTFVGGRIARKYLKTNLIIHVVTTKKDPNIIRTIQEAGFAVTVINANPSEYGGEKYMLMSEIVGGRLQEYKKLVYSLDPVAFIFVQETKHVYNGFIKKK